MPLQAEAPAPRNDRGGKTMELSFAFKAEEDENPAEDLHRAEMLSGTQNGISQALPSEASRLRLQKWQPFPCGGCVAPG